MWFTREEFQALITSLCNMYIFLIDLFTFICNNNPLILDLMEHDFNEDELVELEDQPKMESKKIVIYENKYLDKFKIFSNEMYFTELELEEEINKYESIKSSFEMDRTNIINDCKQKLDLINELIENGVEEDTTDLNEFGKQIILKFYNYENMYKQHPEYVDFEDLYEDILSEKKILKDKLEDAIKNVITDEEIRKNAHESMLNNKLDKFINNYILEHTPLGNVYMRYNNSKKSFEYFSNNTIPYRYLEPVGRKYVMTYLCKSLFVDIEEELKRAEIRFDEDKKKQEEEEKQRQEELKNNPRNVMARMKDYNRETMSNSTMNLKMKNRQPNNVLPSQIKANLANITQTSEKQLLKEHANRYTWEGRLTGFCPLKKIDKKKLDKNLSMSYSEFKRMKEEQNKKYV
jgi:hypothetical protein